MPASSSGGSGAALAAGQSLGALGTDTAGSIRMPAAFCGITGHKPTYGLVGRTGVHPLSPTLDHPGPMTRSALDAALMLDVLAAFDEVDPGSMRRQRRQLCGRHRFRRPGPASRPRTVGDRGLQPGGLRKLRSVARVLEGLGATIRVVEPCAGLQDWLGIGIAAIEGAQSPGRWSSATRRASAPSSRRVSKPRNASAWRLLRLLEQRKVVERRFEMALHGDWDAIVMPTTPMVAERSDDATPYPDKFATRPCSTLRTSRRKRANGSVDGLRPASKSPRRNGETAGDAHRECV